MPAIHIDRTGNYYYPRADCRAVVPDADLPIWANVTIWIGPDMQDYMQLADGTMTPLFTYEREEIDATQR